jgi:hypothetical protein
MLLFSRWQSCFVVLAVMMVFAAAVSETPGDQTAVQTTSADTTSASAAEKAAALLASMPACGVS